MELVSVEPKNGKDAANKKDRKSRVRKGLVILWIADQGLIYIRIFGLKYKSTLIIKNPMNLIINEKNSRSNNTLSR